MWISMVAAYASFGEGDVVPVYMYDRGEDSCLPGHPPETCEAMLIDLFARIRKLHCALPQYFYAGRSTELPYETIVVQFRDFYDDIEEEFTLGVDLCTPYPIVPGEPEPLPTCMLILGERVLMPEQAAFADCNGVDVRNVLTHHLVYHMAGHAHVAHDPFFDLAECEPLFPIPAAYLEQLNLAILPRPFASCVSHAGADDTFTCTAAPEHGLGELQWDWGDGQASMGQTVSHTYADAGVFPVSVAASLVLPECMAGQMRPAEFVTNLEVGERSEGDPAALESRGCGCSSERGAASGWIEVLTRRRGSRDRRY